MLSQSGEGKAGLEEGGERRWELPEGERTPEQSPGREGDTRPGRRWGLRCWTRCFYSSVLCAVSGVSDLLLPCERRGESGSCWGGAQRAIISKLCTSHIMTDQRSPRH